MQLTEWLVVCVFQIKYVCVLFGILCVGGPKVGRYGALRPPTGDGGPSKTWTLHIGQAFALGDWRNIQGSRVQWLYYSTLLHNVKHTAPEIYEVLETQNLLKKVTWVVTFKHQT